MKLRLNKFLSRAGFGARRKVEELILGGIVQVNGTICKNLGKVIDTEVDIVKVEGKRARLKPLLYYAFYKPKGVVSTLSDPLNRKCIGDFMINLPEGLKPVGRLDYSAEGLIFLTNDGDWAQIIQHPKNKVKKVYEVKVQGFPAEKVIQKWLRGFKIDGKFHKMENIKIIKKTKGNHTWLEITLYQGLTNQIKKMCGYMGYPVEKIKRVEIGGIKLGKHLSGKFRKLKLDEIKKFLKGGKGESSRKH